jgi:hypothetical protein
MRRLNNSESLLLSFLAELGGVEVDLVKCQIEPLSDGGMGSFRIGAADGRLMGKVASECHFTDSDGVEVLAALNLDQTGALFEVDIWKVDFTPLNRWPITTDIQPGQPNPSLKRTQAQAPGPLSFFR